MTGIALIFVPFDLDQYGKGAGATPEALRAAGLAARLADRGLRVVREATIGDDLGPGDRRRRVGRLQAHVASHVADAVRAGLLPVIVGGDCCNAIGAWSGITRARPDAAPGVLWFDAHGDWNTEETTRTNYLGGMPYATICGYGNADLRDAAGLTRPAPATRCVLLGVRDLDPLEAELLAGTAVRQLTPEQIRAGDPRAAEALAGVDSVYLHFDVDVLDLSQMPGVRFCVPGGLTPAETVQLARAVRAGRPIAAVTLAALEPGRDPSGLSVETGIATLLDLLES